MKNLNGQDLNTNPDQSPNRWLINFFDWPLDAENDDLKKPKGRPYASDYPDCLAITEEIVKPERDKLGLKSDSSAKGYAKYWWLYARRGLELYSAIAKMERVLVTARVSPSSAVEWVGTNFVINEKIVVFPIETDSFFSLLQSSLHWEWARQYTSTLGAITLNYSPSDCFETFPFPTSTANLEQIGEKYYTYLSNSKHDH